MNLESLDLVRLGVGHDHALEADVSYLNTCTRVGESIEVQRDGMIEGFLDVGEPLFDLRDHSGGSGLGFDDPKFAELDSGACHGASAPRRGLGRESQTLQAFLEGVDLVVCDVENDQFLHWRDANPTGS